MIILQVIRDLLLFYRQLIIYLEVPRLARMGNILPQHCFRRWTGECLDESGNKLAGPTEPFGEWGLARYRMIDDLISDALGSPPVPA